MKLISMQTLALCSGILFLISLFFFLKHGFGWEFFGIIKPATLMQYSAFILFAVFVSFLQPIFLKMNAETYNLLLILVFFCIMATFFEMLWAFQAWFSFFTKTPVTSLYELDMLQYTMVAGIENCNFGAKRNTLFFFMALYSFYFLNGLKMERKIN